MDYWLATLCRYVARIITLIMLLGTFAVVSLMVGAVVEDGHVSWERQHRQDMIHNLSISSSPMVSRLVISNLFISASLTNTERIIELVFNGLFVTEVFISNQCVIYCCALVISLYTSVIY